MLTKQKTTSKPTKKNKKGGSGHLPKIDPMEAVQPNANKANFYESRHIPRKPNFSIDPKARSVRDVQGMTARISSLESRFDTLERKVGELTAEVNQLKDTFAGGAKKKN